MKATLYTLLFGLLFSFSSYSQNVNPEVSFIEVTGLADMEVVPDMIYMKIIIGEKNSGTKSKITIQEQEDSLKAGLKKLNVDLAKLSLSDASSQYVKVNLGKDNVLTTKEYTLLLGDAETLGNVFRELDRLKVSNAYISKVDHSQINAFKQQVRINAIQASKAKADYMLAAIGNETGKPLIIREQRPMQLLGTQDDDLRFRGARSSNTRVEYIDGNKVKEDSVIQFQKIKLEYSVYAKFEIK